MIEVLVRTALFLITSFLLADGVANARIGETYQECMRRYGQPINQQFFTGPKGLGVPVSFKVKLDTLPQIQAGGLVLPATDIEIQVTAWFAKADKRERCWRIDFAVSGPFEAGQVDALLDANKGGAEWGRFDQPKRGELHGEYCEEISYATRSDGTRVERNTLVKILDKVPNADRLRIYSVEYQQAGEANQQQQSRSAREKLKGF